MSTAETFIHRLFTEGDGDWHCRHGQHHRIEWSAEYAAGQGYDDCDDKPKAVLFGNWNDCSTRNPETRGFTVLCRCMPRIASIAEKAGYSIEWEDEWSTCSECGKALRTRPDSYGWRPQYVITEGEILCRECITPHEEIRRCIGDANASLADWIVPEEYGYHAVVDGFETGLHPGQNDQPKAVAEKLRAAGIKRFLFAVTGQGQFDVSWNVYVRARDMKRAKGALS